MKAGRRLSHLVVFAAWLGLGACATDNPAAYQDILGPTREPPDRPRAPTGGMDAGGEDGLGGVSTSAGGAPSGEGGLSQVGTSTTGGSDGGNGGIAAINGGTAGVSGATAGTGASAANPPVDPNFSPACFTLLTQSGEEILKGTPCTAQDPEICYRPCGPNQVGWKTETCTAGVYAEGNCTFPDDKDYACYAIPDEIDAAACGLTAAPAATDPCTAELCTVCNFEGFYQDTGTNVKEGFCVCREAGPDGVRRWTCASTDSWPCPFSQGC